jgi:hypothetical protein
MTITFDAGGMPYGPHETNDLRKEMIMLRDAVLMEGDMEWAVRLSHLIALLHGLACHAWPEFREIAGAASPPTPLVQPVKPLFSTDWEQRDWEREQAGLKPLGPLGGGGGDDGQH